MKTLLLTLLLVPMMSFGQNKKEQIIILNNQVDSLKNSLSTTTGMLNASNQEVKKLNTTIEQLNSEILKLKRDNNISSSAIKTLTIENDKLKKDLAELSKQNLALEAKLKILEDKGDNLITAEGIGKVKLGMTVEELKTFSTIKMEKHFNAMDGGYDEEVECTLKNGEKLNLVLSSTNPRKVTGISTRSTYFKTPNGCKAGMTIKELKEISPNFEGTEPGWESRFNGFFITNLEPVNIWMRIFVISFADNGLDSATANLDEMDDLVIDVIGVGEIIYN